MVAKNNYYWTEKYKEMDFIANGEIAIVRRVRRTREMYGFRFAEVTLRFPDQNDFELDANLLFWIKRENRYEKIVVSAMQNCRVIR